MTPLQAHLEHDNDAAKAAFLDWFLKMTPAMRELCERFPPRTKITVGDVEHYVLTYITTGVLDHAHLVVTPIDPDEDFEAATAAQIHLCPNAVQSFSMSELN